MQRLRIMLFKASVSLRALFFVLKKPLYALGAVVGWFFSGSMIIWSLNLDLVRFIITEPSISAYEKVRFFWDSYWGVFTTYDNAQALGIIIFSALFGLNAALFIYVLRHHGFQALPKKSGTAASVFAVLAGGCVACGTSLLAPLAALVGATSSVFLRDLSFALNWIASLLMLYSIFTLGQLVKTKKLD